MSWQVLLPQKYEGKIGAGTVSTVLYLKTFLVSGKYRIRLKLVLVSYDLVGNRIRFPTISRKRFLVSSEPNFRFQETENRFRGTIPLAPVPLQYFFSTSRPLVVLVADAARLDYPR